jgi:hypothetical protein
LLQLLDSIETIARLVFVFTLVMLISYVGLGCLTKFQYTKYDGGNYMDISQETGVNASKFLQKWLPKCLVLCFVFILIPSKQTLLLFSGVYYGKKTYQQISTNKGLEKVKTIIDLELDKMIRELKQ